MRVAALVAALAHALDKVVAYGVGAAFGLGAIEDLMAGGGGGGARVGGSSL